MNAIRRMLDLFRDSPTYGRDRANLISGFGIGTSALLLNAAVLMLVLPLMLDPNDRDFRELTENVEFGQLLALILLGGATAFATFLIPLRLVGVFMGPRMGRYFDQIVLSGITPLRFVIGKATSQNLFLCLILFLLLPYLVLSLSLGGVDFTSFLACLFLVWLYCMELAVVTLWASLYLNELLAAISVIVGAAILGGFGFAPLPVQFFVVTPFPALIHPVYRSLPFLQAEIPADFGPIFLSCAFAMSIVICVSIFAIYLGPLYGIVRENSTFGEVVRRGDSKRKSWLRLRPHIQRPSEIAFFYENRSESFRRVEGLIRWGSGFLGLTLLSMVAYGGFAYFVHYAIVNWGGGGQNRWLGYGFQVGCLVIHGVGLVLAMLLFSHPRNTTYLRLPLLLGRNVEVSRMDTLCFAAFAALSTIVAVATPNLFEHYSAVPNNQTLFFPLQYGGGNRVLEFARINVEGKLVLLVAGLVIYGLHRLVCMSVWMRSVSLFASAGVYFLVVCVGPLFVGAMFIEVRELRQIPFFVESAPVVAMVSPMVVVLDMFNEFGSQFPQNMSPVPFYLVHAVLSCVLLVALRIQGRKLRSLYLVDQELTDAKSAARGGEKDPVVASERGTE